MMKKSELKEVKKMSIKELSEKVKVLRDEIVGLYLDKNMKKLNNLKVIQSKRKEVAQVLTITRQKQILEQLGEKI